MLVVDNKQLETNFVLLKEFANEYNEKSVYIGDCLKYSTKVKNISNNYINQININFEKDKNITFDAQYIKIKEKMKKIDINKQFYMEELVPQEEVEFYFNIRVLKECNISEIQLKGNIEYTYIDKEGKQALGKLELKEHKIIVLNTEIIDENHKIDMSINSDRKINSENEKKFTDSTLEKNEDMDVMIFLSANKDFLIKGDEVTYLSTIANNGSSPVDILYNLKVDKGLEMKDLSISSKDDFKSYRINPQEWINIEKTYTYNRSYGKEQLMAQGNIRCKFNTNGYTEEIIKKSNSIYIKAELTVFKDFSVENSINICSIKPKMKDIIKVNADVEIIEFYISDIKQSEFEYYEIIGKKVRVRGCIKYIIEYLSNYNEDSINLFYKEKIFSESIYLPEDYIDGELDEVKIEIEDIYYKLVDDELLFINLNLIAKTNL